MHKINIAANPMIGKSTLPDFLVATEDYPELMRISAFDQLDGPLNRDVIRRVNSR
jgi:hypothetical protein